MKYIQSYTDYEHNIIVNDKAFLIPKRIYSEAEMQNGKRNIIPVEDEELEKLKKNNIFNALLEKKKNGIRVLDKLPQKYRIQSEVIKDKEEALKKEQLKNEESQKENQKLKEENEDLLKQLEELKKTEKDTTSSDTRSNESGE